MPKNTYHRTKKVKKLLDEIASLTNQITQMKNQIPRMENQITQMKNQIVRVTIGKELNSAFRTDVYMTKEEASNVEKLKDTDFDHLNNSLDMSGGRLTKMAQEGSFEHHKSNSDLGAKVAQLFYGDDFYND